MRQTATQPVHHSLAPRAISEKADTMKIIFDTTTTPLGLMMVAATDRGICSVQFGDHVDLLRAKLSQEFPNAKIDGMSSNTQQPFLGWLNTLQELAAGNTHAIHALPLDIHGTPFQKEVWRHLQSIPRGETRSYSQVAKAVGAPRASRAVGSACGSNRIALLIPCHRVLRSDGNAGGYRWGLERKQQLLALERTKKPGH